MNNRTVTIIALVVCVCVLTLGEEQATAAVAKAETSWRYRKTKVGGGSGLAGTGTFTVGRDVAVAGSQTHTDPEPPGQITFNYADNANMGWKGFHATAYEDGTKADAISAINITGTGPQYAWDLKLYAKVTRDSFWDPGGSGTAPGNDPMYFDPAAVAMYPIFEETVSLCDGASVYVDHVGGTAHNDMDRVSTLLDSLFYIELDAIVGGGVDAEVWFSSDPSLNFYMAGSDHLPGDEIEDWEVKAILEDVGLGLGTLDGIGGDFDLFDYEWDLSSFSVTSDDTIGGGGISFAASVPEPATLLLLAFGGLLLRRRRR